MEFHRSSMRKHNQLKQFVYALFTQEQVQYNKLPANTQVLWCHLGYTRLLSVNNSIVYIPTWNFCIKNSNTGNIQYRRINAFTGSVMDETISVK